VKVYLLGARSKWEHSCRAAISASSALHIRVLAADVWLLSFKPNGKHNGARSGGRVACFLQEEVENKEKKKKKRTQSSIIELTVFLD